ncbi:MAG TPA: Crp/Fnr family transcriptional regulator [Terriglobia bacterium]|nr:Crp/Fnr family transcriptional regulator [Terriglobia bacterium]
MASIKTRSIDRADFRKKTEVARAMLSEQTKKVKAVKQPSKTKQPLDWDGFFSRMDGGKINLEYGANRTIFSQGQTADSVFLIRSGKVKLSVTSSQGKEGIIALLVQGEFFGEGCLAGQPLRMSTAVAMTDCSLIKVDKLRMTRLLHEQHDISELFLTRLLSRNIRYEEDLVDKLFNSSEKRLARILLLLAQFGKEGRTETIHPGISQENLAQIVGTTRSRVSQFMNKFRKLGFVEYNGGLTIHSALLSVILHDSQDVRR